jgi:ADP-ribosylation factor-like protein 6
MGIFKRLFSSFFGNNMKMKILVVGLDNSGKTTLINYLKPKKANLETVPTIGLSTEEFSKNGVQFTAFDMSGQNRYRNLWEHYYKDAEAIIFVVDSTDRLRFVVARNELEQLLSAPEIARRKVPMLFFANKMDMPAAATPAECMQALQLQDISDRGWTIAPSNALSGDGVEDGLQWLIQSIKNNRADLSKAQTSGS